MISFNYQINHQRNKIGFTQNIKFSTFDVLKANAAKIVGESETGTGRKVGTFKVLMCNVSGITGGNTSKNFLAHLYPRGFFRNLTENLINLNKNFKEAIENLKKEKKKPQGLIFGGDADFENSKDLMVILKYFFDKYRVDHTIFWGTKALTRDKWHDKNIIYTGSNDTWLANLQLNRKSDVIDKKSVLDLFDFVRVSGKDSVKFSNTGWISGKDGSLNKGSLDLTIQDVLKKYGIDPRILEKL